MFLLASLLILLPELSHSRQLFEARNVTFQAGEIVSIKQEAQSDLHCSLLCNKLGVKECSVFHHDGSQCHMYGHSEVEHFDICENCLVDQAGAINVFFRVKFCDEGWYNSVDKISCYKHFNTKMDQNTANQYCKQLVPNSALATLRSREDNENIFRILSEDESQSDDESDGYYIKLNDERKEKYFEWEEGYEPSFTLWAISEPRQDIYFNCVTLHISKPGYAGRWNDVLCSSAHKFICEAF